MLPFIMQRDINGYNGFGITKCENVFRTTLAIGVAQNFTVPEIPNAMYKNVLAILKFNDGGNVFIGINKAATIPSGSFVQTSGDDFKAPALTVKPGDTLSFITPDTAAYVTVLLFCV